MRSAPVLVAAAALLLLLDAAIAAGHQAHQPSFAWPAVARALRRIRDSAGDRRLVEDVWFERLPARRGDDRSETPTDLVQLADSVFDTHRLSWRNALVQGVDFNVHKDPATGRYAFTTTRRSDDRITGNSAIRTFGIQRRRLQLVMMPIMYKLGVITTLLTGLTLLSVKGVTIGVILLILALTSIVAKLTKSHHYASPPPWPGHYDPYDRSSQPQQLSPDKNIHVHVHAAPASGPPGPAPPSPYAISSKGSYDTAEDAGGLYWNRANEEYYNAAMNHYYNNRRQNNNDVDSTVNGAYSRWLG